MKKSLAYLLSLLLFLLAAGASAQEEPSDNQERPDLLTFGRGTVFVSQKGLAGGSASGALLAINGDPYRMALAGDRQLPVEFVFKLPAKTTFDRFAVPNVVEQPGNTTFVKNVVVSGSLEGPDSGYQELAAFELETHGPDEQLTEILPEILTPVRWIKIHFDGGIHFGEGEEGKTNIWFSELIGNGTQEPRELSTAFDGIWDFRTAERLDKQGIPLELSQTGTTITGCLGRIELQGTVNGAIARATGVDTKDGRPSAFIFVAAEDGSIQGLWSRNKGRFAPRTAVDDPTVTSTPCSEAPPEPKACGASVYVNFDVDSAVIRPESEQVLTDLYDRLVAEGAEKVSIVGHTSTEGSAEHNLDLSERRAQSVVKDLTERGFEAANLSATGLGESQPLISPDNTETARTLNRRVEISCSET
ncbi:MAG: OmpA family protein [bacterium]|nr:OmpA family protein [bacterium]